MSEILLKITFKHIIIYMTLIRENYFDSEAVFLNWTVRQNLELKKALVTFLKKYLIGGSPWMIKKRFCLKKNVSYKILNKWLSWILFFSFLFGENSSNKNAMNYISNQFPMSSSK